MQINIFSLLIILITTHTFAFASPNLLSNGTFDLVEDGKIIDWGTMGDDTVIQQLSIDNGVMEGNSAKLSCTSFERKTRLGHSTLFQKKQMNLEQGKWYNFSCWARQKGMEHAMVTAELQVPPQKGNYWKSTLLFYQIPLTNSWHRYEKLFNASSVSDLNTELLFYFDFTGTLWLDDVQVVEVDAPVLKFVDSIATIGSKNLVPNAGFECGTSNWSSLGKPTGWIGGLSGLYGKLNKDQAFEGKRSISIDLGPGETPATSFDFFKVNYILQSSPLVANEGWIEVEPGKDYTLSAYMKADKENIPVKLLMRFGEPGKGHATDSNYKTQGHQGIKERAAVLSTNWQRFSFTTKAQNKYVFVAVGPDMTSREDENVSVGIDAIQLEEGDAATAFTYREPVEVGIETDKYGNVFDTKNDAALIVNISNNSLAISKIPVTLTIEDYFGATVYRNDKEFVTQGEKKLSYNWPLDLEKGFYWLKASWTANGNTYSKTLRAAIIATYKQKDSVFGVNHAPGTDRSCVQLCKAGINWAREWAMNWQHIEPEPGKFDFKQVNLHVDRVLGNDMQMVQQLPPFPSSEWASSAPDEFTELFPGFANLYGRMAFPPNDVKAFSNFVKTVVSHYKDKIKIWEYLNEPFYTTHSLPDVEQLDAATPFMPNANYKVEDYVSLLQVMHSSIKQVDPDAVVIGGLSARPDLLAKEFFKAGGLDHVDIFNLHIYPGLRKPEGYIYQMRHLLEHMKTYAQKMKPIWVTEYAYFGTDTLPWAPYVVGPGPWAANRLLSEKTCSDYSVRYAVIMLAHGVEKIFYHNGAGVSSEINSPLGNMESWMLDYAGRPRKLFAAQTTLSNMLGPKPKYVCPFKTLTKGIYGYVFKCDKGNVLIIWAPRSEDDTSQMFAELPKSEVDAFTIVGNPIKSNRIKLSDSPIYLTSKSLSAVELAESCKLLLKP